MLVLFIPVYALYELSIWIARLIYRRQADDNPTLIPNIRIQRRLKIWPMPPPKT